MKLGFVLRPHHPVRVTCRGGAAYIRKRRVLHSTGYGEQLAVAWLRLMGFCLQ